MTETDNVTA